MAKRHEAIGLKQAIRYEWAKKTADLLLAGLDEETIRQELHDYLSRRKGDGSEGDRSEESRRFSVTNLMRIWVSPDAELVVLRDAALAFLREKPALALPVHWSMICAVYPFWFNVARQTGRLLNLQDRVTQEQIINRLKEQYGDRQSVSRYGRFVVRSFVAWGILKDTKTKGCYEKGTPFVIEDNNLGVLMLEAALHAISEGKGALSLILNTPAFFPFQLPVLTGDYIGKNSERLDVERYGLDDLYIKFKKI
jgi:hypothetical protein